MGPQIEGVLAYYSINYFDADQCTRMYAAFKVDHSSFFLYQGFAEKYFISIYLQSKANISFIWLFSNTFSILYVS